MKNYDIDKELLEKKEIIEDINKYVNGIKDINPISYIKTIRAYIDEKGYTDDVDDITLIEIIQDNDKLYNKLKEFEENYIFKTNIEAGKYGVFFEKIYDAWRVLSPYETEESAFKKGKNGSDLDILEIYYDEIKRYPLLSDDEERKITYKYANLKSKIDEAKASNNASKEIIDQLEKDLKDVRTIIVNHNAKLVLAIARRYVSRGVQYGDLVGAGNVGLLKAIDKFEPEKGYRFSTYATWWIRQSIARFIANTARAIRIPAYMHAAINKYKRITKEFQTNNGREATLEEIIELTGWTDKKISYIKTFLDTDSIASLDNIVSEDSDSPLGNIVKSKYPTPETKILLDEKRRLVSEFFESMLESGTLNERELDILYLRTGMYDNICYTLEEIGQEYGITRERVRQIEKRAAQKCKVFAKEAGLREWLESDNEETIRKRK